MRTLHQLLLLTRDYDCTDYIYRDDLGYIVWRRGTGGNLEILFIEAANPGNGQGRELVRLMVEYLTRTNAAPYHSVFAFRLGSREEAGRFYRSLGFRGVLVGSPRGERGVYRDDETYLHWVPWDELKRNLGVG